MVVLWWLRVVGSMVMMLRSNAAGGCDEDGYGSLVVGFCSDWLQQGNCSSFEIIGNDI